MFPFPNILDYMNNDSDDEFDAIIMAAQEEEMSRRRTRGHRGSIPGHRVINRGRQEGHERLYRDYFCEHPVYPVNLFRRRFRMSRPLFSQIVEDVVSHNAYFRQRCDATGLPGLFSL